MKHYILLLLVVSLDTNNLFAEENSAHQDNSRFAVLAMPDGKLVVAPLGATATTVETVASGDLRVANETIKCHGPEAVTTNPPTFWIQFQAKGAPEGTQYAWVFTNTQAWGGPVPLGQREVFQSRWSTPGKKTVVVFAVIGGETHYGVCSVTVTEPTAPSVPPPPPAQ